MVDVPNPISGDLPKLKLPEGTDVLFMKEDKALSDPEGEICRALQSPIGSESLLSLSISKKKSKSNATACILISDNTRPVPYKGRTGILMPIIRILMEAGFKKDEILILVATGMHKPM